MSEGDPIYKDRMSLTFQQVRDLQRKFESNLVGTDHSLAELNTPDYSLERGVIGEANEALEALTSQGMFSEAFRDEIVDIIIFLATILNHINMSEEEMNHRLGRIVTKNFIKYRPETVVYSSIRDGMGQCRDNFEK